MVKFLVMAVLLAVMGGFFHLVTALNDEDK